MLSGRTKKLALINSAIQTERWSVMSRLQICVLPGHTVTEWRCVQKITVWKPGPRSLSWCEPTSRTTSLLKLLLSRTRLCRQSELVVHRTDRTLRFWFSPRRAGEHLTAEVRNISLRRWWRPEQSYKKSHRVAQPQGIHIQETKSQIIHIFNLNCN